MLQTPSFKHSVYGLQGLAWQSIDPERESVRTGWWKALRAWLAHTWKQLFSPCACGHGASVLAFIWEYVLTQATKALFWAQVLLKIDSPKAQEMSAMTFHLIFYLPDIHHIWHPTSVSLANTNMRHHLGALSASRIITSKCCSCINNVRKPCMETLSPQTFSRGVCSFQGPLDPINPYPGIFNFRGRDVEAVTPAASLGDKKQGCGQGCHQVWPPPKYSQIDKFVILGVCKIKESQGQRSTTICKHQKSLKLLTKALMTSTSLKVQIWWIKKPWTKVEQAKRFMNSHPFLKILVTLVS